MHAALAHPYVSLLLLALGVYGNRGSSGYYWVGVAMVRFFGYDDPKLVTARW